MKAETTVVLGLDGAHFELIEPWLQAGDLPNIKRCIEEGTTADLESCLPPVTSPNWKCYSTGKNPAELGIFWWENIDKKGKRVYYPHDRKHEQKEIWDELSEAGYKVAVINTPLTHPPKEVNGLLVSGGPDAADKNFTYPPELEQKLRNEYNYQVHPPHDIKTNKKQAIEEIQQLIESRFKFGLELVDQDFDFIQITTFYLNTLQHFLWNEQPTKQAWQTIDNYMGKLMNKQGVNLIFMSDHGSNKIETNFNINTWLHEENYLAYSFRYKLTKLLEKLGVNRENLVSLTERFGLKRLLKQLLPKSMIRSVPTQEGEIKQEGKTSNIDWDQSDAFASGQGPIYILNENKQEEIKRKLSDLTGPKGQKVINNVYEKEQLYSGKYLEEAPDLILDQAPHVHITGGIGKEGVFNFQENWKAENKKFGLFIGYGPDLSKEKERQQMSILDLKPMILDLFGIGESSRSSTNIRNEA